MERRPDATFRPGRRLLTPRMHERADAATPTTFLEAPMGTWGFGSFENDDAADWVYGLEEADDLGYVHATLEAAAGADGYLEAPEATTALAAAEVVAALDGRPAPDLPDGVQAWIATHPLPVDGSLRELAQRAVARVAGDSELRELWEEAGTLAEWQRVVEPLQGRLAG